MFVKHVNLLVKAAIRKSDKTSITIPYGSAILDESTFLLIIINLKLNKHVDINIIVTIKGYFTITFIARTILLFRIASVINDIQWLF